MTEQTFVQLRGERVQDEHFYRLHGLPEGCDFRTKSSYVTIEASMLHIDGMGFAASSFEIGQYGKRVVVEQDTEGGMADISFIDAE